MLADYFKLVEDSGERGSGGHSSSPGVLWDSTARRGTRAYSDDDRVLSIIGWSRGGCGAEAQRGGDELACVESEEEE